MPRSPQSLRQIHARHRHAAVARLLLLATLEGRGRICPSLGDCYIARFLSFPTLLLWALGKIGELSHRL
jgi:hypothetical protein